jgi:hypothetical protein
VSFCGPCTISNPHFSHRNGYFNVLLTVNIILYRRQAIISTLAMRKPNYVYSKAERMYKRVTT